MKRLHLALALLLSVVVAAACSAGVRGSSSTMGSGGSAGGGTTTGSSVTGAGAGGAGGQTASTSSTSSTSSSMSSTSGSNACTAGQTQPCATSCGSTGTQTCAAGAWGALYGDISDSTFDGTASFGAPPAGAWTASNDFYVYHGAECAAFGVASGTAGPGDYYATIPADAVHFLSVALAGP